MRRALLIVVVAVGCRDSTGSGARPEAAKRADSPDDPIPTFTAVKELADGACPRVTGAYFYRVEKDGKVAHLLGTRHLGVPLAKFPPIVADTLRASKLAVFETGGEDDPERAAPDNPPLSQRLGPALWTRYQALVSRDLATTLDAEDPPTALLMMMALYEDKTAQLDTELEAIAKRERIPIEGLESSAFQDELIERWLDLRALKAAIKAAEDRAELKQETVDDLDEYCDGTDDEPGPDPDEKADMLAGGYTEAEIARFEEELVYARNRNWIPKLEAIVARGDAFVAVGADHLIGDKGVVALLTARGYKVTRLTKPADKRPHP